MAVIKITSPQAIGNVKLKVIGKPKLILVNGYWNRITNLIRMSPGKDGEEYWEFFLGKGGALKGFIEVAKLYFKEKIRTIKMNLSMLTEVPSLVEIRVEKTERTKDMNLQNNISLKLQKE